MDKIKAAEERNQCEIIYGECSRHPGNNIVNCIHCKTVSAALSTQSPVWVKASERLWEYGQKVIVRYGNEVHYTQYHNITYCVPIESIEWLDESPSSTHPLQEKIDGLRGFMARIYTFVSKDVQDLIKQALETYK